MGNSFRYSGPTFRFGSEKLRGGLYVIQNMANFKFYVGSTGDFRKRKNHHWCLLRAGKHGSVALQRDWSELGEASFRFLRIQAIDDGLTRLMLEQNYLDWLKPAYNTSPTAWSCEGVKRSEETREKLRKAMADPQRRDAVREMGKKPKSLEHKERISESHRGLKHSPETLEKMRESSRRRWSRPEERDKLRRAKLGKKMRKRQPKGVDDGQA